MEQQGRMVTNIEVNKKKVEIISKELFDDRRQTHNFDNFQGKTGPERRKEEVVPALKTSKGRKFLEPHELPLEILKLFDENQIHSSVELYNRIH